MKTTRLRELDDAAPLSGGAVVDADFVVVRARRGVLSRIWAAFLTIAVAAIAGFIAPPLVVAVQALTSG